MRTNYLYVAACTILVAAFSVRAADVPQTVAEKAITQLGQELRKKLVEAMGTSSPAGAIDVCSREAPAIASRIERELGVTIKRTSLKVRNPRNAPDAAETALLETLEAARKAGRPIPAGVVPFPADPHRFYKTITVEKVCLTCHGDTATMNEQVRRALAATYQDDKATGYREGDFRGIISVTVR